MKRQVLTFANCDYIGTAFKACYDGGPEQLSLKPVCVNPVWQQTHRGFTVFIDDLELCRICNQHSKFNDNEVDW